MPSKLRSKTTIESPDLGYDAAEVVQKGRGLEKIENLMNSPIRQQGNPSNSLIEQVEGRGAGNVDMPIIFSNNLMNFRLS